MKTHVVISTPQAMLEGIDDALNSALKIKEEIVSNYDLARSTNDVPAEEYYKYLIEDIEKVIEYIKEK